MTALSWCALKALAMLTAYQYREVPKVFEHSGRELPKVEPS